MSAVTPPTTADRALAAFRALVRSVFPGLVHIFVHEYSVIFSDGATFAGVPTDPTLSPELPTNVPYSPSLAGSSVVVAQGTLAHVIFVNGDPSKPRCVGFDLPQVPTSVTIDAKSSVAIAPSSGAIMGSPTTAKRLVREGDVYTVGTASGPITFVSTTQASGPTAAKG